MKTTSLDNLIELHSIVEQYFGVYSGIKDQGLLESIADTPQLMFNGHLLYDNIFEQAASLMERIIRMHPFFDGNKRTGLLAAKYYLEINGYSIVLPFHSPRFTVMIAKNIENDPESNRKIVKKITKWLCKYSARTNSKKLSLKRYCYGFYPILSLYGLAKYARFHKYVRDIIDDWFALDIYPEYAKEVPDTISFMMDLLNIKSIWDLKK